MDEEKVYKKEIISNIILKIVTKSLINTKSCIKRKNSIQSKNLFSKHRFERFKFNSNQNFTYLWKISLFLINYHLFFERIENKGTSNVIYPMNFHFSVLNNINSLIMRLIHKKASTNKLII